MPPKQRYDLHPGVAMVQKWVRDLPAKTGRDIDQWMKLIRASYKDARSAGAGLKADHDIGSNTAGWMAARAFGEDLSLGDDDPDHYLKAAARYVEEQYSGKKAQLRPIYDRLYTLARGLGKSVRLCPCKTIVPVYRSHVIAQIKPTTNSRVDLGLSLTALARSGKELPIRLIDTGGLAKKDRITHRIGLESPADVDDFVGRWLEKAYRLDA